jgi:type II secretory pathway pseudopilin PulG
MKIENITKEKGITLTETLIYIAILSTVVVGIITISIQLIKLKTKADALSIISQEATKFLDHVIDDVRTCDDFDVVDSTTLDVTTDGVTTRYLLQDSQINLTEGAETYPLTSNLVYISQLEFTDWTSVNSDYLLHIEVEFQRGEMYEPFQTSVHKR